MLDQSQLTPSDVNQLKDDENILFLDVRTPEENEYANLSHLGEHIHIPIDNIQEKLSEIPQNRKIVVYCHHGVRSLHVQHFLFQNEFKDIFNLSGGIDAWSNEIDPNIPKY
jgi:rhodanese-related sulfurtransferase